MKLLSLDLNIEGLTLDAETQKISNIELATRVIKNIILSYAQNQRGLSEEERRKTYKIYDVLEEAVKEKKTTVEMEDDWFGFLKKCKLECKLFPDTALRRVEELIEATPNR